MGPSTIWRPERESVAGSSLRSASSTSASKTSFTSCASTITPATQSRSDARGDAPRVRPTRAGSSPWRLHHRPCTRTAAARPLVLSAPLRGGPVNAIGAFEVLDFAGRHELPRSGASLSLPHSLGAFRNYPLPLCSRGMGATLMVFGLLAGCRTTMLPKEGPPAAALAPPLPSVVHPRGVDALNERCGMVAQIVSGWPGAPFESGRGRLHVILREESGRRDDTPSMFAPDEQCLGRNFELVGLEYGETWILTVSPGGAGATYRWWLDCSDSGDSGGVTREAGGWVVSGRIISWMV